MTHATGAQLSGIRTLLDLRDRCRIDEISGCWLWSGARSEGQPRVWFADRCLTAGKAIGWLVTGQEPDPGTIWRRTCRTRLCVCPEHREIGERGSQMAFSRGEPKSPGVRMRIALTKRAKSEISDAAVRDILASDLTGIELAAKHGISPSYVSLIRRGVKRRSLGLSVFSGWAA